MIRNTWGRQKHWRPMARWPTETPKAAAETKSDSTSLSDLNAFFEDVTRIGGSDLSVMTYFICLRVLSETVGKLEIRLMNRQNQEVTDHESTYFLKVRPNAMMTPTIFKKILEFSRNHFGNSYALIARDRKKRIQGLYPLDPQCVQIYINNTDDLVGRPYYYFYSDPRSGKQYWLNPEDVLHFKGGTPDRETGGLAGKSVRQTLAESFSGEKWAQNFQNDLYRKGLTANAVVKYTGDLSNEKQRNLIKNIVKYGGKSSDKIIPIPLGFDIQPLNLKLTDSQFYEIRKFNTLQIAAAFGVKPDQLNIYDKSSYNNSAMQNLAFLVDTLAYILKGYEEELDYKLLTRAELAAGLTFRFKISDLLRGDIETQQRVLTGYAGSGIYSPNEARQELERPPVEGGDIPYINGAYVPLTAAEQGLMRGGEMNNEMVRNQK